MAEKNPPQHWEPPKQGEVKINCAGRLFRGRGGFSALARNSSGDLVALAYGNKRCGSALEMQLHSILTALQLAEKLKDEGKYDGPVTLETHHALARAMIWGLDTKGFEADDDDDEDDRTAAGGLAAEFGVADRDWSIVLTGEDEIAKKKLPFGLKDLLETDKLRAGLAASETARLVPVAEGAEVGGGSQGGSR